MNFQTRSKPKPSKILKFMLQPCFYALIETTNTNGTDPWAYLKKVFTSLPLVKTTDQVESLLPWKIQQGKPSYG